MLLNKLASYGDSYEGSVKYFQKIVKSSKEESIFTKIKKGFPHLSHL